MGFYASLPRTYENAIDHGSIQQMKNNVNGSTVKVKIEKGQDNRFKHIFTHFSYSLLWP